MLCVWLLQFSLLFGFGLGLRQIEGPRANTENGPVVGAYDKSYSGAEFLAFRGIPYAKPPVGSYRFKEPQRLNEQWIGEWDARKFGSACLQLDHFTRANSDDENPKYEILGNEDCLFVNVYTRKSGPAKKNVIFLIHGGAFMFGSAAYYGPTYIMDRDDVVLVTMNYRLGPLGFITTGDEIMPGNNGLKDQVAALQWVHRNIENFGGDPSKITLAGLSAGGASVDYQFLTPLTKGLFQRGYSFSGSALCPWALVTNGVERTKQLAEGLGCPTKDSKTLVKCLRRRPAQRIIEEVEKFLVFFFNPFTIFGPVVENSSTNYFINQHPREILQQGLAHDLPWVAGVTSEDGLYPVAEYVTKENALKTVEEKWDEIGEGLLFLNPDYCPKEKQSILTNVKKQYFGDEKISLKTRDKVIKLFTERDFVSGVLETAQLRKKSYLYYYTYQSATSFSDVLSGTREKLGASHVDDFVGVVDFQPYLESHTTKEDRAMAAVIKNIFFDFVLKGKVPKEYNWNTFPSSKQYLVLNSGTDYSISEEPIMNLKEFHALFSSGRQDRDDL